VEFTRELEMAKNLFVWNDVMEKASMAVVLAQKKTRVYRVHRYT
jgi:hypothetical protein